MGLLSMLWSANFSPRDFISRATSFTQTSAGISSGAKAFNHYRLKIIGGSVVGISGVILLNHSLGSISPRKPHEWTVTGIGAGLVGAGLLISKGAKKKRQEAKDIIQDQKKNCP